jgi:hypothetical protein
MPNKHILTASLAGEPGSRRYEELDVRTASRLLEEEASGSQLSCELGHARQSSARAGANGSATTSWSARP